MYSEALFNVVGFGSLANRMIAVCVALNKAKENNVTMRMFSETLSNALGRSASHL
jgi:hypothetical protein